MKSIPMADRRLSRSIVLVITAAVISGYRNLQRNRQPQEASRRAPRRGEARRH